MSNPIKWCECELVTGALRDMHSTCITCGGIDAYKGHPDRSKSKKENNIVVKEENKTVLLDMDELIRMYNEARSEIADLKEVIKTIHEVIKSL